MPKLLRALLLLTLAGAGVAWMLHAQVFEDFQKLSGAERLARARATREPAIREKFGAAAVGYPGEIFIRIFKHEAALELWARSGGERFRLVATHPILKSSGEPGPKRREGDRQVPEGFYFVERFNPESLFHLSLGLNYPNAADRVHADPAKPGTDIFIHGKDVSVGCAPIGDAAIEELYLAAHDARAAGQARTHVHIFPARMSGGAWKDFAAAQTARRPELATFWKELQPAFDAFERTRLVPHVHVSPDGRYEVEAGR